MQVNSSALSVGQAAQEPTVGEMQSLPLKRILQGLRHLGGRFALRAAVHDSGRHRDAHGRKKQVAFGWHLTEQFESKSIVCHCNGWNVSQVG
jgi:hypothetical protein